MNGFIWVMVVVSWYGDTVNAEAVEITYEYEQDCIAAQDRLEGRFEQEREKDPLFGYIIMDCERVQPVS